MSSRPNSPGGVEGVQQRPAPCRATQRTSLTDTECAVCAAHGAIPAEVGMPHVDEQSPLDSAAVWPSLPLAAWQDTYATLHMWLQIVGKIRLALSPPVNHWWHVTLYVTSRGLTTSPIPYGSRTFTMEFDFIEHHLLMQTGEGTTKALGLFPRSVAEFYHEFMGALRALDIE